MASPSQWIAGARLRTLPMAVAPVLIGAAAAAADGVGGAGQPSLGRVVGFGLLALVVALALQVGTNYANDYSDGIRGTDDDRVGPFRLTGSGAARPAHVKRAALLSFAAAGVVGLVLVAASGAWWMLLVGAFSIWGAWFYTGGRRPYGYLGLGEVFVFVFFGLAATLGTTVVILGRVTVVAVAGAVAIGFLAVALLVANNLRDIPTDAVAGKRTLAVRLGDRRTRLLYVALLVGAGVLTVVPIVAGHPAALIALLAAPIALRPARIVLGGATGRDLIVVLKLTSLVAIGYAAPLAIGLVL